MSESAVAERLISIRARLDAIQPQARLLAVSKAQDFSQIRAAYDAGQRDFAENYAQELLAKAAQAREAGLSELRWHFVGHLQTNKIALLLPIVASIHSVESVRLASKLADKLRAVSKKLSVFLEVNIDREPTKSGFLPEALIAALGELQAYADVLTFEGLMTIPRPSAEGGDPARGFAALRALEQQCRPLTHGALSMGMSDDFEVALGHGATHVRVGTALFGKRVKR